MPPICDTLSQRDSALGNDLAMILHWLGSWFPRESYDIYLEGRREGEELV